MVKISGDSSFFFVTAFNNGFEGYINTGGKFQKSDWTYFKSENDQLIYKFVQIVSLDITSDGQWIALSAKF